MAGATNPSEPSYIDYELFQDPTFSPHAFANSLILSTNNPSDTPLDLSTPLSKVLFDVQEIDAHIHNLTTKSALPLLSYTKDNNDAGQRILKELQGQVQSLTEAYKRLEREVIDRWEAAEEVRLVTERLWRTVRLGRAVGRCLLLGRQLELQLLEYSGTGSGPEGKREDHRALVRAAHTILSLRQLFSASGPGQEGEDLDRVTVVNTLMTDLVQPAERNIRTKSQQIVREFSMSFLSSSSVADSQHASGLSSSASTYAQTEDTKARLISALNTLYLLSPTPASRSQADFEPTLMISALQTYLQTSLTSSLASLSRALATLPTLDRTLLEVSARCQNIVALEALLDTTKPPFHPLLVGDGSHPPPTPSKASTTSASYLTLLLQALDTSSLPSYFWRSLAGGLGDRVREILQKGGVSARTLRTNRDRVRDSVRECVLRGSEAPAGSVVSGRGGAEGQPVRGWEREAAVMVGAIVGPLQR